VGQIYLLKLGHLVADKIHARAVGPYSLVTQQPLEAKRNTAASASAKMEVWAMEGTARLRVAGIAHRQVRRRAGSHADLRSIVKGDNTLEAGTPSHVNVLMKNAESLPRRSRRQEPRREIIYDHHYLQGARGFASTAAATARRAQRWVWKIRSIDSSASHWPRRNDPQFGRTRSEESRDDQLPDLQAEKGGLFCERIFGPSATGMQCGKYKRIKHRGVICIVAASKSPWHACVASAWATSNSPCRLVTSGFQGDAFRMGLMLDMTARELERVLYYEDYIVIR